MRKILLTTPYDLAVEGGVNNQLWGLYRSLKKVAGYEVRVIGPSSDTASHDCPDLIVMGAVFSMPLNRAMSNITPDIRILSRVKALLKEFRPDIVHLQEPLLPILNTLVLYYSRGVNVGTYHTYSETSRGYDYWRPVLKWHHKRVHVKIAVSDAAGRFVARTFPDTYHIIPNAVEMPAALPSDLKPVPFGKRKKTILFVGRMNEPRKGFYHLLDAHRLLDMVFPGEYRLVVAGPGRESLEMEDTKGEINWLGRISEEELRQAYASCDIVCTPSLGGESFGITLLEAFAHGKPVVASDIVGYREFAGDSGAALLVQPGSSRSLANGIVQVLGNEGKYLKMSAAARALAQRHEWSTVTARIIALYDSALAERK